MLVLLGLALSAFAQDTGDDGTLDQDRDGDGFTVREGDCDDDAPAVNPNRVEVCFDEIDNDCNFLADELCDDSIRLGSLSGGGACTGGGGVGGTAVVVLPLLLLRRSRARRGGASA